MAHLYTPSVGAWGSKFYAMRNQVPQQQGEVDRLYVTGRIDEANALIAQTNNEMVRALENAAKDGDLQAKGARQMVWGARGIRGSGLHRPTLTEIANTRRTMNSGPGGSLRRLVTPPPRRRGLGSLRF